MANNYTNSTLVEFVQLSPNMSKGRDSMSGIAIHCMAGNMTIESCGAMFSKPKTGASSHYGIGSDGRVGQYVSEADRPWCTSDKTIDRNCASIEVANIKGAPNWECSDLALRKLIILCADICRRNNFRLRYDATLVAACDKKFNELVKDLKAKKKYNTETDKAARRTAYSPLYKPSATHNIVAHRWVSNKGCPGNYLYNLFPVICFNVNRVLDGADIDEVMKSFRAFDSKEVRYEKAAAVVSDLTFCGVDLTPVFDHMYYSNSYDDLKKAFGTSKTALFQHFCNHGMNEGRKATSTFDPKVYRARYSDLEKQYGNDWMKYYAHYCLHGIKEGRKGY